jgi:hypothetical protein
VADSSTLQRPTQNNCAGALYAPAFLSPVTEETRGLSPDTLSLAGNSLLSRTLVVNGASM